MNRYVGEFKKFISRGNVVDMAVGVIVGSAFSAIVTALSNNILKPIVNYLLAQIFDAESLTELYTFLKKAYIDVVNDEGAIIGQEIDLAQSIYIDWGALINAVLSFFLIASLPFFLSFQLFIQFTISIVSTFIYFSFTYCFFYSTIKLFNMCTSSKLTIFFVTSKFYKILV